MRISAVIFDWDGTLFDSVPTSMEVYRILFRRLGIAPVSDEIFRKEFLANYHHFYKKHGIGEERWAAVDRMWLSIYAELAPKIGLVDGAKELISQLEKKGVKIGLFSNGSGSRIREEFVEHGFAGRFDVVITADEVPEFKPDPKGVMVALKHLGVRPEEAIYVGDLAEDIQAGKAAGTKTAGVLTGLHGRERLAEAKPDYIFENAREVLKLL